MQAKNGCKTMAMALTGWKAIVYDITRKESFNPAISTYRVTTDEAMRELDSGNFGG